MSLTPEQKSTAWEQLFKIVVSIITLGLSNIISRYKKKDK